MDRPNLAVRSETSMSRSQNGGAHAAGASVTGSYIGASMKRVEDDVLLRGAGRYLDDLREPGMLHLAFVRSPYAHARLKRIATGEALALPGVIAVLTADDLGDAVLEAPSGPPGAQLRGSLPLA